MVLTIAPHLHSVTPPYSADQPNGMFHTCASWNALCMLLQETHICLIQHPPYNSNENAQQTKTGLDLTTSGRCGNANKFQHILHWNKR